MYNPYSRDTCLQVDLEQQYRYYYRNMELGTNTLSGAYHTNCTFTKSPLHHANTTESAFLKKINQPIRTHS